MSELEIYKGMVKKMKDEKLNELIQWLEKNIKNLKRQSADNIYMEGFKQGMIKNGELILGKARNLLDES